MSKFHHLSLAVSGEMWNQMLGAALPMSLGEGSFELQEGAAALMRQLQVKERVVGLLEQSQGITPRPLQRMTARARKVWASNRQAVYRRLDEFIKIEGTWTLELDELGTDVRYGAQKVMADAYVRGVAEGRIVFLNENVSIPFHVERRVGATVALGRVRYSSQKEAIIGNLQDLGVHLGEGTALQLLARLIEYGLAQQLQEREVVQLLTKQQVAGLVGGLGGPLKLSMGVDDLDLEIADGEMVLKVRFGFSQAEPSGRLGS